MFDQYYKGKRVFLTGHTGFKGSWMCEWLLMLGAEVFGYALDPQKHETLFDSLALSERLAGDTRADISDQKALTQALADARPDVIFHFAAQPLVRKSYEEPVATWATNVMGTVHLLNAVRVAQRNCTVVCITTDKCYENREWMYGYREEDPMGGHDPYSASKGAAELVIASYRKSFFSDASSAGLGGDVRLASARAGNVIGGGDWAQDRIVPDCIRALRRGEPIPVRNKLATRPWQHVLEPLSGYLCLAANLRKSVSIDEPASTSLASGFNFGPALTSNRTVAELVQELLRHIDGKWVDESDPSAVHEASKLNLSIDKAYHLLGWQPVWGFEKTVEVTAHWYRHAEVSQEIQKTTHKQIQTYHDDAQRMGLPWAVSS